MAKNSAATRSAKASDKSIPRPSGRAPKGKEWDYDNGLWIAAVVPQAPLSKSPPKPKVTPPSSYPPSLKATTISDVDTSGMTDAEIYQLSIKLESNPYGSRTSTRKKTINVKVNGSEL